MIVPPVCAVCARAHSNSFGLPVEIQALQIVQLRCVSVVLSGFGGGILRLKIQIQMDRLNIKLAENRAENF